MADRFRNGAGTNEITPQRRGVELVASRERTVHPHGIPQLRILRQRKGLSLSQLSEMTGIRRDTITHLEHGREDPQPYHIRALARVLEVPTLVLAS